MGKRGDRDDSSGGAVRYVVLMFGILAALVALFFAVRAVSIHMNEEKSRARRNERTLVATDSGVMAVENQADAADPGETESASGGAVKEEGATESTDSEEAAATDAEAGALSVPAGAEESEDTVSGTPDSLAEAPASEEGTASAPEEPAYDPTLPGGPLLKNEVPAASAVAAKYFDAVTAQDEAALEAVIDQVPDQLRELVRKEHKVYSDVEVYTKNGPDDRSYIVIATYRSVTNDSTEALPNYKQWLIRQNDAGEWQIIRSELDTVTQSYVDAVMAEEDVQTLVSGIEKQREEALAAAKEQEAGSGQTEEAAPEENGGAESQTGDGATDSGEQTSSGEQMSSGERTAHVISNVNLRKGGGFQYEVIGLLPTGAQVTLLGGDEGGWYHVSYNGQEGYAGHSYLSVD